MLYLHEAGEELRHYLNLKHSLRYSSTLSKKMHWKRDLSARMFALPLFCTRLQRLHMSKQ